MVGLIVCAIDTQAIGVADSDLAIYPNGIVEVTDQRYLGIQNRAGTLAGSGEIVPTFFIAGERCSRSNPAILLSRTSSFCTAVAACCVNRSATFSIASASCSCPAAAQCRRIPDPVR